MMPSMKALLVLALSVSIALSLSITSIALENKDTTSNLVGSVMGGQKLYIEGLGFSLNMGDNTVWIGNYQCKVGDGATPTTLLCITSPTQKYTNYWNLAIVVVVKGVGSITATQRYSYTVDQTPYLNYIFPSVSYGGNGTRLYWNGHHRITDLGSDKLMGSIYGMYIGDSLCSRFGIYQDSITAGDAQVIQCFQPSLQKAGKYNVSEHLYPGRSTGFQLTYKASLENQLYQFVVLPLVNQTTSSGSMAGQDMEIKGTGFSQDPTQVSVSVDGVNCNVTESTLTSIKCKLDQKTTQNTILPTNALTPANRYIAGTGFFYQRWDISGLGTKTSLKLKQTLDANNLSGLKLQDQYISGEMRTPNAFGQYYGEVWKGYFVPTATGNHVFSGVSDDGFSVYISKEVYGSTGSLSSLTPICTSETWTSTSFFFNVYSTDYPNAESAPIYLQAGKAYYMQAYHVNQGGPGSFSLAVEIPNSDPKVTRWQTHEVQIIETSAVMDPEVIEFRSTGATFGTINLRIRDINADTLAVRTDQNVTFLFNSNKDQFCAAMNALNYFREYGITCNLTMKNSANETVTQSSLAVEFIWVITILKQRPAYAKADNYIVTYSGGMGQMTITTLQDHSPLIGGTFTLTIDGLQINSYNTSTWQLTNPDIPFNVDPNTLKAGLRTINGFEYVQVERTGDPLYGARYIIYFIGYNGDVPDLVIGSSLTGGRPGTEVSIVAKTRRPYSTNLFVDPIDYRWMRTYANLPTVQVTVNRIQSACNTDCRYRFLDQVPELQTVSLSSNILSVTLSDPLSLNAPLTNVTITLAGQPCIEPYGNMTNFTCRLPKNPNNAVLLTAGSHYPVIRINPVGYVVINKANVNQINVQLRISQSDLTAGNSNGGYELKLKGVGFPVDKKLITFTLCNQQMTVRSLANTQAIVVVPACGTVGATQIQAQFNGLSASLAFTYNPPSNAVRIDSISPTSWSPVMKGVITVTGAGFGADQSIMKAYLTNATGNMYEMRILSMNDTEVKVGIPGGLPGKFDVNIAKNGFGYAAPATPTSNDFTYQVVITSVSPLTGSVNGGTLLTITGRNFVSDPLSTMVSIGNQLNQLCRIESITTTQIKCRIPPKHKDQQSNTPLVVEVNSKLIMPTVCKDPLDPCWFQYVDSASSPILTNMTVDALYVMELTGKGFDLGNDVKVALLNKITKKLTVLVPTSYNATNVNVTLPALQAGYYDVRVRVDPIGETNVTVYTQQINIDNVSSNSLSINGAIVTINGVGFPETWPNTYYNKLSLTFGTKSLPLQIVSMSSSRIVFVMPPGFNNKQYLFNIITPQATTKTVSFYLYNSATPTVNLLEPLVQVQPQVQTKVKLNRTVLNTVQPETVQLYSLSDPTWVHNLTEWTYNTTKIEFSVKLNSGRYGLRLFDDVYGWYSTTVQTVLNVASSGAYTVATKVTSFNGGYVTVTGNNVGDGAVAIINGLRGKLMSKTVSTATFIIPKLITPTIQSSLTLAKPSVLSFPQTWGDSANWQSAFDHDHSTVYSSNNSQCFMGVDAGEGLGIQLSRIRYFPNYQWNIASLFVEGGRFEASNDNLTWVLLTKIDQTVHAGWNSIYPNNKNVYRYVRFVHDQTSKCGLAEIQLSGIVMNNVNIPSVTSFFSNLVIDDGHTQQTFLNAIEYRQDSTPVIEHVTPEKGDVFGGYTVTLTGKYLNISAPEVKIDGVECQVTSYTATQIQCIAGARPKLPTEGNSFDVVFDDVHAVTLEQFKYVMRWSDIRTWGTDLPPVQNDLVYVPKGMHLLVDQTTPKLQGIVVENATLQFSDEKDMQVHAGFITLRGGQFIAGTQEKPYSHQLTFIMYGGYYGKQQPMFGNKGIGCRQCKFTMHGQKRTPTWTMIQNTIKPGDYSFTTIEDVDWKVGEMIVVASTSYDHNEAEMRMITAVNGRTITVNQKFVYQHYAGVEFYGLTGDKIEMRAEVGLLTRNIKMMGDDTSVASDYGSHLMLMGSQDNGFVGKVAYVEFSKCGQPKIVGRYCHHFHMNGDIPESYSIGNAVHHSLARILTIHGVHYLYVAKNVGYRVKGHNFFLEDGIETHNIIEYNLAISSLLVNNMMQTDMSVASFWVTNPTNTLRYNHAAGSDFYGIWYEIKENPDGPSATEDICPIGNPLEESHDNVAHSNVRFGLRIFQLSARQDPCKPARNDSLVDPWSENPSIESKFYNYVLWKNGEAGLLAQETGNVVFENFTIAESKRAGMQFYKTNITKQNVVARNFAIIGRSSGNPPKDDSELNGARGVILSRTGYMQTSDIRFYNFLPSMTVWQACSRCDDVLSYTNLGAVYFTSKIKYNNVQGNYLNMLGLKREVFYDQDGSLTSGVFDGKTKQKSALVQGFPHLLQDPACKGSLTNYAKWDSAAVCDQSVTVRQIFFTNIIDTEEFRSQPMKVRMLSSIQQRTADKQPVVTTIYSLQKNKQPKKEKRLSYSLPYLTNRIYNVWWGTGLDFSHLAMITTPFYQMSQPAIIFKFNYTDSRQLYEVAPMRQERGFDKNLIKVEATSKLSTYTCGNGDYYHDNSDGERTLQLCASGRNSTYHEYVSVNAVYCREHCPKPEIKCVQETFIRDWSNATQWPGKVMPSEGHNVTIPCPWNIRLDMDPVKIGYLQIDGDLFADDTRDVLLQAENIWITDGSLKAGSKTAPFTHKFTIQLNGLKNAAGIVISPQLAGNKMLVNTGRLQLFGTAPSTVWTKLIAFADAGSNTITVESTSGWKIGDQLAIAPSFMSRTQFEQVTITNINMNTVTFTPALKFNHFGDLTPTIVRSFGTMDMRAGVGHLTRNIKIKAGPDSGWGFTVIQFGYLRQEDDGTSNIVTGKMTLSGVEFIQGGQYDTMEGALQVVNVKLKTQHTLITKSSFHDCQDFCVRLENSFDIEMNNNVFFNARKFHVRALAMTNFAFTNNLMIGVKKRPFMVFIDLMACFVSWTQVRKSDNVMVKDNLCQGSQGHGFAVPMIACQDIDSYPYQNNTAGSCQVGWIFNPGNSMTCIAAKGVYTYSTLIGNVLDPGVYSTKFKNFIMADNQRSMTIRIGGNIPDKTGYVYDSYITAIARPNCMKCYGEISNPCKENYGVRLMTTGLNTETMPDKFGAGFDVVCKAETIGGRVFIYNTEFNNFKRVYSGLSQCSDNVIFKPHPQGTSFTASHHLFNSNCTQCQMQAMAWFTPPPESQLGWLGGCGDILCTGNNNYFIEDHSGTFLPAKGVLLANNSWIGDNTPTCQKLPQVNGHYCTNQDFNVLQYQSIAPDYNKRIMWPVYLKYDGGNWTTQTNGWRQWQWSNGQPMNRRLGRFVSVIKMYQMYNMTFTSMPPEDMTFRLQHKVPQGNNSDWVIIKLHYPKPNSIRVQVNQQIIKPISLLTDNTPPLDITKCGSNKFFYQNYTIHFVVTGDMNCKVRVSLTNTIQLTTKFDMDISKFYSEDGVTKFIDRMCALLGITDTSRVKVVGVYEGSVELVVHIEPEPVTFEQAAEVTPEMNQAKVEMLNTIVQDAITSGAFEQTMKDAGFGEILSMETTLVANDNSRCFRSITVDDKKVCTVCNFGFTLTQVQVSPGVLQKHCLTTKGQHITHCSHHVIVDNIIKCSDCNQGYDLIDVNYAGTIEKRCINSHFAVENCNYYTEVGTAEKFKCEGCRSGDRELAMVQVGLRLKQKCLVKGTETLPYCDMYVELDGKYYCRHGHCQEGSAEITIGSQPKHIACTKLAAFPSSNACLYYQRPKIGDSELLCAACKDSPSVQQPYCTQAN